MLYAQNFLCGRHQCSGVIRLCIPIGLLHLHRIINQFNASSKAKTTLDHDSQHWRKKDGAQLVIDELYEAPTVQVQDVARCGPAACCAADPVHVVCFLVPGHVGHFLAGAYFGAFGVSRAWQ